MKNISKNSYRENRNKFYVQLYFFKFRAVYEIMWENIVERGRQQDRIQYGTCALHAVSLMIHTLKICNTHAFPLQQYLHERASMLRYMYIACLLLLCLFCQDRINGCVSK